MTQRKDSSGKGRHRNPKGKDGHRRAGGRSAGGRADRRAPAKGVDAPAGPRWLYGQHAVTAALANPQRNCHRLLVTDRTDPPASTGSVTAEPVERTEIEATLPPGAVHQGLALLVDDLPEKSVSDIAATAETRRRTVIVALDRVTDPQNVGAVLRSAAAFGAAAVMAPDRHTPEATGALAKAASGALETVPLIRPSNLVRALDALKDAGFWVIGLDAQGDQTLASLDLPDRCVLALGAEGSGLRRLTRETCDLMARVPIAGSIGSLNVSASAAVALYEWTRQTPADT